MIRGTSVHESRAICGNGKRSVSLESRDECRDGRFSIVTTRRGGDAVEGNSLASPSEIVDGPPSGAQRAYGISTVSTRTTSDHDRQNGLSTLRSVAGCHH